MITGILCTLCLTGIVLSCFIDRVSGDLSLEGADFPSLGPQCSDGTFQYHCQSYFSVLFQFTHFTKFILLFIAILSVLVLAFTPYTPIASSRTLLKFHIVRTVCIKVNKWSMICCTASPNILPQIHCKCLLYHIALGDITGICLWSKDSLEPSCEQGWIGDSAQWGRLQTDTALHCILVSGLSI